MVSPRGKHRSGVGTGMFLSFNIISNGSLFLILTVLFLSNAKYLIKNGNSTPIREKKPSLADSKLIALPQTSLKQSDESDIAKITPIPTRVQEIQKDIVKHGDYIYYKNKDSWDSSPIVIESHKLVFFSIPKVGCTVWKQLFRRMMNQTDWKVQDGSSYLPHNPELNGLKYLYHYSVEEASVIMTSNDWTRAMMVREPKERFLSAFLDKAVSNDHLHIKNICCPDESCIPAAQTIAGFLDLCHRCYDDHWRPQNDRVDKKYWPYIDFALNLRSAESDADKLLKHIGAWDQYGKSGWGENGTKRIFQSTGFVGSGEHSKYARWEVWKWYNKTTEELVEQFYQEDYDSPMFNFTRGICLTCV